MQSSIDMYDVIAFNDFGPGNTLTNGMTSSTDGSVTSAKSFVHNRVKYDEPILRVQAIMARRLKRVAQKGIYAEVVEEGKEAEDILLLLSSLRQTNNQNENTIQNLQRQLDAANQKSHKLMKVMTRYQTKHETELSHERQKFAAICAKHNEEAERFARDNAESAKVYEHRLAELQNNLDIANKSNTEISSELCSWKKEVEVLAHGLEEEVEALAQESEEAKAVEKSDVNELVHMATLKEIACRDTMKAHDTCKILQVEIDVLRKQARERSGSQDGGYNTTSSDENENQTTSVRRQRKSRALSLSCSHDHSLSILSMALSLGDSSDYNDVSNSSIMGDNDVSYEDSSIIGFNECSLFSVSS